MPRAWSPACRSRSPKPRPPRHRGGTVHFDARSTPHADVARPVARNGGGRTLLASPAMTSREPLPFDPILRAAALWDERIGPSRTMAAVTSVMRVQQILLSAVDGALRPHGLTFARYEALVLLSFSRNGRLPMRVMGERLQLHPTSVTNIVDRLQADGLVRRVAAPDGPAGHARGGHRRRARRARGRHQGGDRRRLRPLRPDPGGGDAADGAAQPGPASPRATSRAGDHDRRLPSAARSTRRRPADRPHDRTDRLTAVPPPLAAAAARPDPPGPPRPGDRARARRAAAAAAGPRTRQRSPRRPRQRAHPARRRIHLGPLARRC